MTDSLDFSFDNLSPEAILKELDTGWPWPLSGVQEWFEDLWNSIAGWVSDAASSVVGFLSDATSTFWELLKAELTSVVMVVGSTGTWLNDQVQAAAGWVWDQVSGAVEGVRSLAQDIWDFFFPVPDWISSTFWDIMKALWDALVAVKEWTIGAGPGERPVWAQSLADMITSVSGVQLDTSTEHVGWLGEKVDNVVDSIKSWVVAGAQDIVGFVTNFFSPFVDFWKTVASLVTQEGWGTYTPFIGKTWQLGARQIWDWFSEEVGDRVVSFTDDILQWVKSFGPMSPAKSTDMAAGLLSLSAISIGGLAAMTLGGELMHPLKEMGLGNISAMIGDVVNYRMISGIIVGAILGSGLRTPLNYYINDLLRPWLLQPRDFMELFSRRAYTEPEVLMGPELASSFKAAMGVDGSTFIDQMLGFYGYPAQYRAFFEELANTRLGYFALAAVARDGTFDEAWFTESLHRAGYSERVVQRLLDMYRRAALETARGQFASTAFKRYREGLTDVDSFATELEVLGYGPDKIERFQVAGELDRQTDVTSDLVAAYRSAFRKGRMSQEDFKEGLLELGITLDRVNTYIQQETIWRGGELAPEAEDTLRGKYASTAIRSYREGFSTREDLEVVLGSLGYSSAEIQQLTLRAELEYQLDFQLDLLAAYRDLYRKDAIAVTQFREALLSIGMVSDRVEGWVFREKAKKGII